jgi:glycerol-3-phosphate acyltransferase PlsY
MSPAMLAAGAYLLGAIPFGLILGRVAGGIDVRRLGSGNIGATNVGRHLGIAAGILTLAFDLGKGAAAAWAGARLLGPGAAATLVGMAALVGHVFPVYLGFRGGKGVATGWGVFLVLAPVAALCVAGFFLAGALVSRRVSVGSLLGALSLPVMLALLGATRELVAAGILGCAIIVLRHRDNIRNLRAGTEPRFGERRG